MTNQLIVIVHKEIVSYMLLSQKVPTKDVDDNKQLVLLTSQ